jgi:TonB family protein
LSAIFVSYRRNDSQGEAGRLFDDLVSHFGEQKVFMDVAGIEAGRDFRKAIEESVANCGVLLVVMGPAWVTAKNESGLRRLDDPGDFVRAEVASALRRDIPVIPVLVHGAVMPRVEELPDDLKDLAYRNCVELTHARWKSDVQVLLEPLRRLIGSSDQVLARAPTAEPKLGQEKPPSPPSSLSGAPSSGAVTDARFDAATLQRIGRELAMYIGPIADVWVSRATRQSGSLDELIAKVAEEIESPQRRDEFLRKVSSLPVSSSTTAGTLPRESLPTQDMAGRDDNIDAETPSSARGSSGRANRFPIVIGVTAAGIALLSFLIFKTVHVPAGAGSSTPRESGRLQSSGGPSPVSVSQPAVNSPAPESKVVAASHPIASVAERRVRVPTDISQNLLLTKVVPTYPQLARQARIQGEVVLDVDISKEGTVESLRTVRGHPLLIPAAIDAVKNWRYKPYIVDGQAVPVQTQVTVNFTLKTG